MRSLSLITPRSLVASVVVLAALLGSLPAPAQAIASASELPQPGGELESTLAVVLEDDRSDAALDREWLATLTSPFDGALPRSAEQGYEGLHFLEFERALTTSERAALLELLQLFPQVLQLLKELELLRLALLLFRLLRLALSAFHVDHDFLLFVELAPL